MSEKLNMLLSAWEKAPDIMLPRARTYTTGTVAAWIREAIRSGYPAQPPFKLGDIVRMRDGAPFSIEWRGITMKVVSLRVDPQGTYWISVVDETEGYPPHHRGNGVYDGETTDIDADHLCSVSSTDVGGGNGS